ncbi:Uncharacterized conserved protein YndB, AHSA1/START domain [Pelagibacterium halotolerans]|uniref:Activator of Hsp90 ATPase homologue 1/2-like C-terminal domain-containing protein n=2 Tax=Pelagibacterium TaxID=1082930 RepID=G4REG0_PELHB|nr:hypothetical protein KKY_2910 [Pelagibacterium halotolerans B2]SEA73767.1 Uncharacterized conserved protein YndB, AHSA1/START domain [Pelagibacterium halotolerans]
MPYATLCDQITIATPAPAVWNALVDRDKSRIWAGADFATDWQPGSSLVLTPLIVGKKSADKGEVLRAIAPDILSYRVLPRVSGLPDLPENYSLITIRLAETAGQTRLEVTHSVPASPVRRGKNFEIGPDSGRNHVAFYWRSTLPLLRDLVENRDTMALRIARHAARQ